MQGGTISSGRLRTFAVAGWYWISWISSFSNTTSPAVTARLRPTSNADSSLMDTRPSSTSSIRWRMPVCKLSPWVSSASCSASGLVAAKLAGLMASIIWRV